MASDRSESDLQRLAYKARQLDKSQAELERSIQQIESMVTTRGTAAASSNSAAASSSVLTNPEALRQRLLKLREAAIEDDNALKVQGVTIDQQERVLKTIRSQLVTLRERVTKYMSNNNNNNNSGNSNNNANDTKMRGIIRGRLLMLRSEIMDMCANQEAALTSKTKPQNVSITYWNGRGLAEPLRLVLAACDIDFKNNFLSNAKDLEQLRAQHGKDGGNKLFYEQVPLVMFGDMCLTQSGAAMRYIARRFGMYGESDKERYVIDLIYEGSRDARRPFGQYMAHGTSMEECKKGFKEERYFGGWESQLSSSKSDYFTSQVSMADISVFEVLDYYNFIFGKEAFNSKMKKYPNLFKLYKLIYKLGRISTYIEKERNPLPREEYKATVDRTLGR